VTAPTPLQWDGTTATGDGVRYGITRDRQAMIWLVAQAAALLAWSTKMVGCAVIGWGSLVDCPRRVKACLQCPADARCGGVSRVTAPPRDASGVSAVRDLRIRASASVTIR
jgi:hypothetical protein